MKNVARLSVFLLLAVSLPGCQSTNATWPYCEEVGVLFLEAQSVPSAQMVPCIDALPLGWEMWWTDVDHEGSWFSLNSSIGGHEALTVTLAPACNVEGHIRVPTDEAGTERYELVESVVDGYRGTRTYLFDGGCTTLEFRFEVEGSAALVNEASLAVGFVSRAILNDAVREVTDGREQLDP